MARQRPSPAGIAVSTSALDLFANAVGALAFLLLLFVVNSLELIRPTTLRILTERLPVSRASAEYLAVLAAVGGAPPYGWTLESGSLPEGLALDNPRGEIVGAPDPSVAGSVFPVVVAVTDSREQSVQARFEIRVLPRESPRRVRQEPLVLLTHGQLPDAYATQPYELYLSARGGSGRYRWSAEGLPEGLSLDANSGRLDGLSRRPGTHELVLRVEDATEGSGDAGRAVAAAFLEVLSIEPTPAAALAEAPPEILSESLPAAIESEDYEVTLAGSGQRPLRWWAENLPPGLEMTESGVIRGKPLSAGEARVRLSMEDSRELRAPDKYFVLEVEPQPATAAERGRRWGLWRWLGYVLLVLLEVAVLYSLRRRMSRDIQILLKAHNVNLIQKADGTTALNGAREDVEAFRRRYGQAAAEDRRYRIVSYFVLAVALIAYTAFLFR